MRIAIVGTGYVGLTTAVTFGFLGHQVTCVDVDERRICDLADGRLPFHEPNLPDMFEFVNHELRFTTFRRLDDRLLEVRMLEQLHECTPPPSAPSSANASSPATARRPAAL